MKICIARLRSGTRYTEPLQHIIDSFCECLRHYVKNHPEHRYAYYNFSWGDKPIRDELAIKHADVIIIPSEAEFTYHIPGAIHTLDVKKSNEHLEKIKPYFKDKLVINLRSDRRDDEELYRKTLGDGFKYTEIDEIDFFPNIHAMKFHFIRNRKTLDIKTRKIYDFAYWGSDKRKNIDGKASGDERHIILREIKNSALKTQFIGRFWGFDRDERFKKMIDLLPTLEMTRTTLCFNWLTKNAISSRYGEAIACGMIPFVWKDYDIENTLIKNPWQRIASSNEFIDKVCNLRYDKLFDEEFSKIEHSFVSSIKSLDEYIQEFDDKLTAKLV